MKTQLVIDPKTNYLSVTEYFSGYITSAAAPTILDCPYELEIAVDSALISICTGRGDFFNRMEEETF